MQKQEEASAPFHGRLRRLCFDAGHGEMWHLRGADEVTWRLKKRTNDEENKHCRASAERRLADFDRPDRQQQQQEKHGHSTQHTAHPF